MPRRPSLLPEELRTLADVLLLQRTELIQTAGQLVTPGITDSTAAIPQRLRMLRASYLEVAEHTRYLAQALNVYARALEKRRADARAKASGRRYMARAAKAKRKGTPC